MLAEATGFAFLAAISPTALFVMAVFLGSANPRLAGVAYVTGAIVTTAVMAVVVLLAIRWAGLDQPRHQDARYDLRLAVGILGLAAAGVVIRPRPRRDGPAGGIVSRLVETPTARSAFLTGVILFLPSATFIAAVQVVATASVNISTTVVGLLIVIVVSAFTVWLPLIAYLRAPEPTTSRLGQVNGWQSTRGKALAACALAVAGAILVINGALGLT